MGKWLAGVTAIVIAVLVLLWLQIRSPHANVTSVAAPSVLSAPTATTPARSSGLAGAAKQIGAAQGKPEKLDPSSDAFFYKFDEAVPPALTAEAAKCYEGGGIRRVHRNQKVKLGYTIRIKDGVVSIQNVKVVESTVNDKKLEDCFAGEVAKVTWRDDELPDWQQEDELVLRPERGMKKFSAANLAYEGDGPIGTLESAGDVAASRELPR